MAPHKHFLSPEIIAGKELGSSEIEEAVHWLLDSSPSLLAKAEFLRAFHHRGETPSEVAVFASCLLAKSVCPLPQSLRELAPTLDVCGTGGDQLGLFNVSTAVLFVVAACGAFVVKHGNRAATSRSGGADVLEVLGVSLTLPPERVPEVLESAGCVFLFAPFYHPSFQAVSEVRRLLAAEGTPSIFNFLGPLLNPARPDFQLVGIFEPSRVEDYAQILGLLGRQAAWVVCGEAGTSERRMDEISTLGTTHGCCFKQGIVQKFQLHPADFGVKLGSLAALQGGDVKENARLLTAILQGKDCGPRRDIVLVNAAAALCLCGLAADFCQAMQLATEALASGEAFHRLQLLVHASR